MKMCMGCMEKYEETLTKCPHCGYEENTKPAEAYHMVPGSILKRKYIVGKTLGYGGFGVTYIGFDAELQRKVAIKEYLPGEFSTRIPGQTMVTVYEDEKHEQFQSGINKFMDEAKRLAKFQDTAGIVHIYDSFFENETAYIVMEYIEGETVKEKLDREGKIPVEEAIKLILPIVAAMKEVHAEGIIHRDISPDNIMVDKEGNAKLIDFGASRYATTTHSKSLSVLIKYGYAPMEQYQSGGQQGTWTDVYALAATFYTMVTGIVPEDSLKRLEKDELKPLSKMGIKISKNMDMAIRNAMNVKVEERTPSMEVFEEELLSEGEVARLVTKQEKKDNGKWPVWIKVSMACGGALVALFVILLSTGIISFSGGTFGNFVVAVGKTIVPNVVNSTMDQAEVAASGNKLQVQIVGKVYSDEIPEGYVLEQNIKPGTKVDEESILELTISAGVEMVFMPSVEGIPKEDAIVLLEEQELKYTITEVESMTAVGNVVSQSIAANEKVAKGTEITLEVSKGMNGIDVSKEIEVPDLQGYDYTKAQEILAELGLYIGKESEVFDNKVKKGLVLYQSIPAGNIVHQGDTIMVRVSKGKEQVPVPNVWLDEEQVARKKLSDAGLMAEVVYESSETVKKGLVISQKIEKDKMVDVGTTVQIVVSTGKKAESEETKEPEVDKSWSDWMETLPAGVTSDKYEIDDSKHLYSYRTLSTTQKTGETTDKGLFDKPGYEKLSEKPQYSEWSSWTESKPSGNSIETQEKQQWAARSYQYTQQNNNASLSGWECYNTTQSTSGWSEWSTTYPGDQTGRDIRKEDRVTGYKTQVWLSRYYYNGYIFTYKPAAGAEYDARWFDEGSWTRTFPWDGGPVQAYSFNGNDFFDLNGYKTQQVPTGYQTWYSYQDTTTTYYFRKYGDWSAWSDSKLSGDDVKTRTLYSYRNVSYIYEYRYTESKWSDWSTYGENEVTASDTTEVRKKTLYRYRLK